MNYTEGRRNYTAQMLEDIAALSDMNRSRLYSLAGTIACLSTLRSGHAVCRTHLNVYSTASQHGVALGVMILAPKYKEMEDVCATHVANDLPEVSTMYPTEQ